MTTTVVRLLHCDHASCDRTIPEDQAAGWGNAIYTHGCPDHAEVIAAHQAKVTSRTRGRGSSEKDTWFLVCACGWSPRPNFQVHNATRLKVAHLAHLAALTEERQ